MDCSFKSGWCISTTGINHPEKNRDNALQDAFEDTFQDSCEEAFDDAFDDDLVDEGDDAFDDAFDVDDLIDDVDFSVVTFESASPWMLEKMIP